MQRNFRVTKNKEKEESASHDSQIFRANLISAIAFLQDCRFWVDQPSTMGGCKHWDRNNRIAQPNVRQWKTSSVTPNAYPGTSFHGEDSLGHFIKHVACTVESGYQRKKLTMEIEGTAFGFPLSFSVVHPRGTDLISLKLMEKVHITLPNFTFPQWINEHIIWWKNCNTLYVNCPWLIILVFDLG